MITKKFLRFIKHTLLIILGLGLIFFINGFYEKAIVNDKIEDFKARAEYIGPDENLKNVHYYRVKKEYDYEDVSRNTFTIDERNIGSKTDVIITNRNPMRGTPVLDPLVGFLASNFYVGHSSMNSVDDGSRMYEVVGNSGTPGKNVVIEGTNDWYRYIEDIETPVIVGVRIKDTTEEQRDKMVEYADQQLGKGYNYSFIFNRANTYYCTDLVSRSAKYAGLNINYDHFATTGNDMIISKNTYIFFLRDIVYEDGEPVFNIYFLENEE